MPKSESSRLLIEGYMNPSGGNGTYNAVVDIPDGYRPVSWNIIMEEWPSDQLVINKVFLYRNAETGKYENWQFAYTLQGFTGSPSISVVVRIIVERSDEIDAFVSAGNVSFP